MDVHDVVNIILWYAIAMSTLVFLLIWLLAAVAWELYALSAGKPTISRVVSEFPWWVKLLILLSLLYLSFHWHLV